jgi:1,4-dihydroxy-2-naphthoate octaprenyltransferase
VKLNLRSLRLFIRLSHPLPLLGGFLLYGLGSAIASFLGRSLDLGLYLLGQSLVTILQLAAHFSFEYHEPQVESEDIRPNPYLGSSRALGPGGLSRQTALNAIIVCLAIAATLVSILLVGGRIPLVAWLILLLIFLGYFFYSTPPVRLLASGYGELVLSLVIAGLIPTFSFALQTGELHRLILMSTTPLVALHFAMMISFELPEYARNIKLDKRTLMVRLGWATAMRFHDLAIVFAIASFLVAFINGLPKRVAFGALIALPLAAVQVWHMERIRRGFPARLRNLTIVASGLFGLTIYLELIGYLLS